MKHLKKEFNLDGKILSFETGKVAKQANGSVWLNYGNLVLMSTVVIDDKADPYRDFVPLSTTYLEKDYSKGILNPPSRRENPNSLNQILISRLIDRPIRPLFPAFYRNPTILDVFLLSNDKSIPSDTMVITAASLALCLSRAPYSEPMTGVRVCLFNNEFIVNPDYNTINKSDMNIFISGTDKAVTMLEAECNEVDKKIVLEAIKIGYKKIKEIIEFQKDFLSSYGIVDKIKVFDVSDVGNTEFFEKIYDDYAGELKNIYEEKNPNLRNSKILSFSDNFNEKYKDEKLKFKLYDNLEYLQYKILREVILKGIRPDGRKLNELRSITCERNLLPSAKGSSLFTRGQTQSLGVVTVGPERTDGNIFDNEKNFFLHYNFPPFSVGDSRKKNFISRREHGHGALAEKCLRPIVPFLKDYRHGIRLVSEILESNGSSSMASVCSGSIALKDAEIPIKSLVAGLSIGLVKELNDYVLLSDIQGFEDHFGDMDFKVAGTKNGITGIQLDIKIDGVDFDLLYNGMCQAEENRFQILEKMEELF